MKNITLINSKYLLLLSIITVFIGCTDLEEDPVSLVVPDTYYSNDAEFNAAINGAIRPLFGGYSGFGFNDALLLSSGDEQVTSRLTAPNKLYWDKFLPDLNASSATNMWSKFYLSINDCNQIISKIPESTISDESKASYEGQARFIRALDYFYLTRWFGEVPIITMENQADAANVGQSPVIDIYSQIIEDLTFAENNLPEAFTDKGRPTKGAAKAMLADVYLTMAGWPLKDESKYALARDKAKEVMDLAVYQLEPVFSDLWRVANKFTNSEVIFMFNGDSSNGSANASTFHQGQRPGEEGGWNDVMSEARFINVFPEGPRKDATFWTVFADEAHTKWEDSRIGQPYIGKFRDAGPGATYEQGAVSSFLGDMYFPIYRYAEVLLIYAEAANRAENGPSPAALDAINEVRRRASGNDLVLYPDLTAMSMEDFDAEVIAERNWELAFECKRWFDMVRKEMVVEVNQDLYPYVDEHNLLIPKPQVEVDMIEGLEQNPGY